MEKKNIKEYEKVDIAVLEGFGDGVLTGNDASNQYLEENQTDLDIQ